MVLIDACAALVRGLGVEPHAWRELTLRYLSDPHPAAATSEDLDATAKQLMHAAHQEAIRAAHGALGAGMSTWYRPEVPHRDNRERLPTRR